MINKRIIIRASQRSLTFLKQLGDGTYMHVPYVPKSGMSISANLRTAFREEPFFEEEDSKVLLSLCSPTVLVPLDLYKDEENYDIQTIYNHSISGCEHDAVISSILPSLNVMVLYSVNKDLKLVVDDRFADVRTQNVMQPVWSHLHERNNLVPQRNKLYGYFHDGQLDIFAFQQRRFKYANSFPVLHAHDAMYYLLFVWKQLAMNNESDELHLVGTMQHQEWLLTKLRQFLRRVYPMNPVADLNRAAISQIKNLQFDMML